MCPAPWPTSPAARAPRRFCRLPARRRSLRRLPRPARRGTSAGSLATDDDAGAMPAGSRLAPSDARHELGFVARCGLPAQPCTKGGLTTARICPSRTSSPAVPLPESGADCHYPEAAAAPPSKPARRVRWMDHLEGLLGAISLAPLGAANRCSAVPSASVGLGDGLHPHLEGDERSNSQYGR